MLIRHLGLPLIAATLLMACGPEDLEADVEGELADSSSPVDSDIGFEESALAKLEYKETRNIHLGLASDSFNVSWGMGGFRARGDYFFIWDKRKDNRSVGIHWRTKTRQGICRRPTGASVLSYRVCDMNFREGEKVLFRLGRCNTKAHTCKTLRGWTDWTGWRSTKA